MQWRGFIVFVFLSKRTKCVKVVFEIVTKVLDLRSILEGSSSLCWSYMNIVEVFFNIIKSRLYILFVEKIERCVG